MTLQEEVKALKEKFVELENRQTEKRATRIRNMSGDIDFSDPFLCEMEIGRLSSENQALASQLEEMSAKVIYMVQYATELVGSFLNRCHNFSVT